MGIINYQPKLSALVATKGHPYPRDAFSDCLDSLAGITSTIVEQPASQQFLNPSLAAPYDVLVFYDMPGVDFSTQPPTSTPPSEHLKENMNLLFEAGKGMVFLHHALASWPMWPEFGEIIGGRFFYNPQDCRGRPALDSGYRHEVKHDVSVASPNHPIAQGLPATFQLSDELYLCEVFEDSVEPLLRSSHDFVRENFYSAHHAVTGKMYCNDNWHPAQGSSLVGWTRQHKNSRIVYLQPGDGTATFGDPNYRLLLANAIRWAANTL
ncbi:MAG: ThuA domain-containing protein [Luminiphilus sp.]|nr:ThuA domain-containing protein [Luminiphilus sp.]